MRKKPGPSRSLVTSARTGPRAILGKTWQDPRGQIWKTSPVLSSSQSVGVMPGASSGRGQCAAMSSRPSLDRIDRARPLASFNRSIAQGSMVRSWNKPTRSESTRGPAKILLGYQGVKGPSVEVLCNTGGYPRLFIFAPFLWDHIQNPFIGRHEVKNPQIIVLQKLRRFSVRAQVN